uniref:Phosphorylase b kinase regulatory subunit n=1 Tax=Aceria tosichella TaxID=561515 RepID=A0A6G1SQ45_9ACAR
MRSRTNSGQRLDYFQRVVYRTILDHQNPVSGLLPTTATNDHAWVRDNVYSILAVWSLSMAYKKNADLDEDRAKTYELEQSCVKLMRGLLMAMIRQVDKVEKFKETQSPSDALHAKYSASTMSTVVGDSDWGHLQLDATSLYLLVLAQMTASGLQIIFNLDEVAFLQNLVFYIESAYCVPDYGIWERGDKTNHGLPELNGSSVGLAKAALEAMDELDLFGGRGGPTSVIHVLPDNSQKCHAVLQSMLPRESNSKEVDAALLPVISFPAFAVEDAELIDLTRRTIVEKLQGRYGCKRFLRDGFRTAREDPSRLYYEPWELKIFEGIECEWPVFFCYLILDACFQGNEETAEHYAQLLDKILIKNEEGIKLVPESYTVPPELVELEYKEPHSQDRVVNGQLPFMWGQSLYIVSRLLLEGFIAVGELDPLNRRLGANKRPDVVVQVVVLADDAKLQEKLRRHDIHIQTVDEVRNIEVHSANVLSKLYSYLGKYQKLNLSGRSSHDVGLLSTSKLYRLENRILAFTPQFADPQRYYVASDVDLLFDSLKNEIAFLKKSWRILGRPVVVIRLGSDLIDKEFGRVPMSMLTNLRKIKSGYINDTRVALGTFDEFLSTSCVTDLSFLSGMEEEIGQTTALAPKDMLNDIYERACQEKKWALVRHMAGVLNKQVEDLAKSLTDLLVRQKQVTVGLPPNCECTITRPMTSRDLSTLITRAHGGELSTAMLSQEILLYLAMFIRTEPHLFLEMLRIRVGLIIQVMASELARSYKCSEEEANDHLLNLSPFEVKALLHHILSGREFKVKNLRRGVSIDYNLDKDEVVKSIVSIKSRFSSASNLMGVASEFEEVDPQKDREGQWLRRRRLDGALNRVPKGFYPKVWSLLERCHGISINGRVLMNQLTREMTSGELKFALQVEQVLTSVPQPEYRQLMVEGLMVLTIMVEQNIVKELGHVIEVEQIVRNAHEIFLDEQRKNKGNSTRCCASRQLDSATSSSTQCGGAADICQYFYDSAPSGTYGTMTYLMRSYFSRPDIIIQ